MVSDCGSDSGGRAVSGHGSGNGLVVCGDDDDSGSDVVMGGGSDSSWSLET